MRIDLTEWGDRHVRDMTTADVQALAGSKTFDIKPAQGQHGGWTLSAKQHVGFARFGDFEIRVAPKTPVRRLLELIVNAIDRVAWSRLEATWPDTDDLISTIAGAFVVASETALAGGILQGYRDVSDEIHAVRGRIDMGRQMTRASGLPLPVSVTYDEYTIDVLENQVLAGAGRLLLHMPGIPNALQRRLRRLDHRLAEVRPTSPTSVPPSVPWTRLNERYRPAVTLARIILAAGMIEFEGHGSTRAPGFLIDMNKVFEDVVGRGISDAFRNDYNVDLQHEGLLDPSRSMKFRPDIIVRSESDNIAVADIKYKRAADGVSTDDLFQVVAYAVRLDLRACMLIYPERPPFDTLDIGGVRVTLASVDLDASEKDRAASMREVARRMVPGLDS